MTRQKYFNSEAAAVEAVERMTKIEPWGRTFEAKPLPECIRGGCWIVEIFNDRGEAEGYLI